MKKNLPINSPNQDVVVSWVYAFSRQQQMSIHEQRIMLRLMQICSSEIKGVRLADYIGQNDIKCEHGLFDVTVSLSVSLVVESCRTHKDIEYALFSLRRRTFMYEDNGEWWACGFIEKPVYKKGTGMISFNVDNKLWDIFTKFVKGYREFELDKALALPTGYAIRFYIMMSGQKKYIDMSLDTFRKWLGIPDNKYKYKDGRYNVDLLIRKIIEPSKQALDAHCPYSFTYKKLREDEGNARSTVTGFRFTPVRQDKYRDQELEKKKIQARKGDWKHKDIDPFIAPSPEIENFVLTMGFSQREYENNMELFDRAEKELPNVMTVLMELSLKSRDKDNPNGWIIQALRGKLRDQAEKKAHAGKMEEEYKSRTRSLFGTADPDDLEGELAAAAEARRRWGAEAN